MCVTIFGLTVCVSRVVRAEVAQDWYPGKQVNTVERWRNEAQWKGMGFR
jgi:hypothetical protein